MIQSFSSETKKPTNYYAKGYINQLFVEIN